MANYRIVEYKYADGSSYYSIEKQDSMFFFFKYWYKVQSASNIEEAKEVVEKRKKRDMGNVLVGKKVV